MAEHNIRFNDGEAYERFMGRWSRVVGAVFLDWLAAPPNARWLDVGCGTGAFTRLVVETRSPIAVTAIDPLPSQIDHARRQPIAQRAEFQVADAQQLPFPDGAFDVVASALVINFIPDRPRALAEMHRVGRRGGIVAGYVWDFAGERGTASPLRHALRQIGVEPPVMPGFEDSRLASLESLFKGAGLDEIATRTIDIAVAFANFDEFWRAQMPAYNPTTKAIMALPESDHARFIERLHAMLPAGPDGSIAYSARAHAVKARVPQ
jgi:ubiquinone/menaquinone biosynthesis C-methylase UbiE